MSASPVNVITRADQGAPTHRISDLWFYVNGKFQGAYPVGNFMPVITGNEPVRLNIFAGIRNNGANATRIPWLLYQPIQIDTFVQAGTSINRPLNFEYHPNAKFAFLEGFGENGIRMQKSAGSDSTFRLAAPSESFDGHSAELGLSGNALYAQIESSGDPFALPSGNPNVYLELNYKCNAAFSVGLIDQDSRRREVYFFSPSYSWNKIYIELGSTVSASPASDKFKLYFRLVRSDAAADQVFLDNIKVVYL